MGTIPTPTPEELNEISKSKLIPRPNVSVFSFCSNVIEAEYFYYGYAKTDDGNFVLNEDGERVVQKFRRNAREERLYDKPETTMSRAERIAWFSKFKAR